MPWFRGAFSLLFCRLLELYRWIGGGIELWGRELVDAPWGILIVLFLCARESIVVDRNENWILVF